MAEEIQLKGGFTTKDRRLDRIPQHDPRNRLFLSRKRTLTTLEPIEKTWQVNGYLDQGFDGACVGFGFSHNALSKPKANSWVNYNDALNLYYRAQVLDDWEGGAYPDADPFYEGTSVLAGALAAREKGYFKQFNWTYDVEELIITVGHDGPAVIGVNWYENMMDTDRAGYIYSTGEWMGGHCTLVYKVSPSQEYFGIWNSWGPYWGESGTAKISFEDMAFLLADDGEACIPVERGYVIDPHER